MCKTRTERWRTFFLKRLHSGESYEQTMKRCGSKLEGKLAKIKLIEMEKNPEPAFQLQHGCMVIPRIMPMTSDDN